MNIIYYRTKYSDWTNNQKTNNFIKKAILKNIKGSWSNELFILISQLLSSLYVFKMIFLLAVCLISLESLTFPPTHSLIYVLIKEMSPSLPKQLKSSSFLIN